MKIEIVPVSEDNHIIRVDGKPWADMHLNWRKEPRRWSLNIRGGTTWLGQFRDDVIEVALAELWD